MSRVDQWEHSDRVHDRATRAVADPAQMFLDDLEAGWSA